MADINGTAGADTLNGTAGADHIVAGDGNDTITDGGGGNDIIDAGAGNDRIEIVRTNPYAANTTVSVLAGTGDDLLYISNVSSGRIDVDMGAGNDTIRIASDIFYGGSLALGAGVDHVIFESEFPYNTIFTFSDFQPGNGGDQIHLQTYLENRGSSWDPSTNPFTDGYLQLVQSGTNVILRVNPSGGNGGFVSDLAIFQNTTLASFSAHNFVGFAPDGSPPPGVIYNGTAGDDSNIGTGGNDELNGNNGNDILAGGAGNDSLKGGAGNDTLDGGRGDDIIDGGDGDDHIIDAFGSNSISGGAGNDLIDLIDFNSQDYDLPTTTIIAGIGDDVVNISGSNRIGLTIDLGAGNDRLNLLMAPAAMSLTLGQGRDIVDIEHIQSIPYNLPVVIQDFQTGDNGDTLVWEQFIRQKLQNWDPDFNPFAFLLAGLRQVGSDTILESNGYTYVVFRNTQLADFTAANLGFDPDAPVAPGEVYVGTAGGDIHQGTPRGDTISGFGGDDDLSGANGDDVIDGGSGDDYLSGGTGNDIIRGGDGNDDLNGGGGIDTLYGEDGDDRIHFFGSDDIIDGGADFDTLTFMDADRAQPIRLDLGQFHTNGTILLGGRAVTSIENIEFLGDGSYGDDVIVMGSGFTDSQHLNGYSGNDSLTGGNGDDFINGNAGDDRLYGLGGLDQLEDMEGNNFLDGGDGDDTLVTGAGNDRLFGGGGNDLIYGNLGNDEIDGGAGNDELDAGMGMDVIRGGAGNDSMTINLSAGDVIDGQSGTDTLTIGLGRLDLDLSAFWGTGVVATGGGNATITNVENFLFGFSAENDRLIIGEGTATSFNLDGFDGNDTITGGAGSDRLLGNRGNDILNGGSGDDDIDGGAGDDSLFGGAGNDHLLDYEGTNSFDGGAGNDFITGSGTLRGGAGDDQVFGSGGNDILSGGAGVDQINGHGGDDTILLDGGTNNDQVDGDSGYDRLIATASNTTIVWTNSLTGRAQVLNVENISDGGFTNVKLIGSEMDDAIILSGIAGAENITLTGSIGIYGLGGNDSIIGSIGNDTIFGGDGADRLDGGLGADNIHGGAGNDVFIVGGREDILFENAGEGTDMVIAAGSYYLYANIENLAIAAGAANAFGVGNVLANIIEGNAGSNLLLGGGGNDVVRGAAGIDSLFGEEGADQLFGDDGNDYLAGGLGNDTLHGGFDADALYGEAGADQLFGDAGIDYLVGGIGNDTLDGGADADALYGEDGDDTLTGGTDFFTDILVGGAGNDILRGDSGLGDYDLMDGGSGNDSYYVDTPNDLTFEATGGGTDTVYANINGAGYYLYANVENLVLQDNTPFGVGNELANSLTGNVIGNYLLGGGGNDRLNGKAGNDVLFGEAGADTFVFERGTGGDVIGDFVRGTDRIDVSAFGFASFDALKANFSQVGIDGAINLGNGDFIVLNGVTMSQLAAGDFIMSGGAGKLDTSGTAEKFADANASAPLEHNWDDVHWLTNLDAAYHHFA